MPELQCYYQADVDKNGEFTMPPEIMAEWNIEEGDEIIFSCEDDKVSMHLGEKAKYKKS